MNMKMKNDELNKAFDDVVSLCDKTIKACQNFRNMDINKTTEPSLETQRDEVASPDGNCE
jgi:hypothetical protein